MKGHLKSESLQMPKAGVRQSIEHIANRLALALERLRVLLNHLSAFALWALIILFEKCRRPIPNSLPVSIWPPVKRVEDLSDLLPRIEWVVPRMTPPRPILIPSVVDLNGHSLDELQPVDYLERPPARNLELRAETDHTRFKEILSQSSVILVWRASALMSPHLFSLLHRVAIVDPKFRFILEYVGWGKLLNRTRDRGLAEEFEQQSRENFAALLRRSAGYKIANLFGRGPNLVNALSYDLSGQFNVISNGIVGSDRFLKHTKPSVIACIDAAHHIGPSRYGVRFRKDLVRAAIEYDAFVVIPNEFLYLLAIWCPEIRSRLIGLKHSRKLVVPTPSEPFVRPRDNVLTFVMLPIALSINPKLVQIWGCDGRSPSESGTFVWRREKSVEYESLANTTAMAHPSYFRDFVQEDYYTMHCKQLADWLIFAEQRGVTIRACTPSFIPCLNERQAPPFRPNQPSEGPNILD